jgi:hypothetical protein
MRKILAAALIAAAAAAPVSAMAYSSAPPMHHRHLVKVTGVVVSVNEAKGRITLDNHKTYHFRNPQMVSHYKVGEKITLSFWA